MNEVTLFSVIFFAILAAKAVSILVLEPLIYWLKTAIFGHGTVYNKAVHNFSHGITEGAMGSGKDSK